MGLRISIPNREKPRGMVIVAGHAIYQDGVWYGGYKGEDRIYEEHVIQGYRVAERLGLALIVSGGETRPHIPQIRQGQSEAKGMYDFAVKAGLTGNGVPIIQEPKARDSFSNILYSLFAFKKAYGEWPRDIHAVSLPFKQRRWELMASGIGVADRLTFHGVGHDSMHKAPVPETAWCNKLLNERGELVNPFLAGQDFEVKRTERTPLHLREQGAYTHTVKQHYDTVYSLSRGLITGDIGRVIDMVEIVRKGNRDWSCVARPWLSNAREEAETFHL
jgi:hypothetical protein